MAALINLAVTAASTPASADADRQAEISQRGAQVMPFNLAATKHVFTKTPNGATQQVVVRNRADGEQVRLIRQHLNQIAVRFQRGDFSAPTDIHGAQMPGLAELKAKPGQIAVRYEDLPDGGQIEYSARNASLVAALHRWVDAQLADHGADAMQGHEHHHTHTIGP